MPLQKDIWRECIELHLPINSPSFHHIRNTVFSLLEDSLPFN